MICVYEPTATDFSNNGLGTVSPLSCTVTETLNGEWELTMEHPLDEQGKWRRLVEGCILRAPVPAAMTPQIKQVVQQPSTGTEVYRVSTQRDPLRLRSGTGTKYKILAKYKKGTKVIVLNKTTSSWYEVSCPDGKRGYMASQYLTYVRTESDPSTVTDEVIESRQLRDQPFRIYRVVPELTKITVHARHIFYDLLDNMIRSYKPSSSTAGASVVQKVSDKCESEHDFTFYSDLDSKADEVEFININPVEALLGEGGVIEKYSAELVRDWFDVFLVNRVGSDTDVQIREGKNLLGVSYDVDLTNVTTRIMPTGEDKDGKVLYLPELYVDSPNIDSYHQPKWMHLPVSDAKEVPKGDGKKTKAQCYTAMRKAAQAEYDKGCDLPTVTLKVDFVNCADTEEYRSYHFLQNIFLGDTVRVIAPRIHVAVAMRMTQYSYDCLQRKYTQMTLGTVQEALEGNMISGRQIPSGCITDTKLAADSVGSLQLKAASVVAGHIDADAITTDKLAAGVITAEKLAAGSIATGALQAGSVTAEKLAAHSVDAEKIAAGSVTADKLDAETVDAKIANVSKAHITDADIDWAVITNLRSAISSIAEAQITNVTIRTAQIDQLNSAVADLIHATVAVGDFSLTEIQNLLSDAMILERGNVGTMMIKNLIVTEANLLNATVGRLVMPGADGKYYEITVGSDGTLLTQEVTLSTAEINDGVTTGGKQIVATTINTQSLHGSDISAEQAILNNILTTALTAGQITAGEALLASATIPTLYVTAIRAIGNSIDISANEAISLLVESDASLSGRMSAAEQKITDEAIITTVTQSDPYQELTGNIDSIASASETALGIAEVSVENVESMQVLIDELSDKADSTIEGIQTLQTRIEQNAGSLSIIQTQTNDLEGHIRLLESGIHIEGGRIGIWQEGSPYQNTITHDGWVISENESPIITCAETKLTAPRVQITDAMLIGGLAWRPTRDRHVRLLKFGR